VTPILDIHEALDAKWAEATGTVGRAAGRKVVNQPLRFSGRTLAAAAPALGAHTARVLAGLGYSRGEIRELRDAGAVS